MTTIEVMRKALSALLWEVGSETSVWAAQTREAITALRAELERLEGVEPVAFMWQHDETGRIGFIDHWQRQNGFEANNPRCKIVAPLYTAPIAPAIPALTDKELAARDSGGYVRATALRWAYALAAERAGSEVQREYSRLQCTCLTNQLGPDYCEKHNP